MACLVGCTVGDVEGIDEIVEDDDLLFAGANPCANADLRAKANVKRGADGRFVGTNRRDIIFGTPNADAIFGNGGDDLICGLDGNDTIDGGNGRDRIYAGPGDDTVHGRGGSDRIWGGPGKDVLFGDILDDHLYGEDNNDALIGGHGTDVLDGGQGNDFLRGDTGFDVFSGGDDHDIASWATALPPGQPEFKGDGTPNTVIGVKLAFEGSCDKGGCANGDGGNEPLHGIEEIIGSSFKDQITAPGRVVHGGLGADLLAGAPGSSTGGETPVSTVFVDAVVDRTNTRVDVGVVVLGSPGVDTFEIVGAANNVITVIGNKALTAGPGCTALDATRVRCDLGGQLHYVLGWGDDGADRFELRGEFPRDFETHVSGGNGSDRLLGGEAQDNFFTGTSGADHLEGRGGDDTLLGESHHTDAWRNGDRPEAATYNDGADTLDGGPGNDQLVVDYVCGGHRFLGGAGVDIAGFARSGRHPIHAQLGGPSTVTSRWWGFAANMDLCGSLKGRWTSWRTGQAADLEVLETSDGPDHLWGDDRANVLWGRGGGDKMLGLGGNDELLGADGNDEMYGGAGHNYLSYGRGH